MRRAFWFALACCLFAFPSFAQRRGGGGQVGLGIALGDPSGFTAKFLLSQSTAFDLFVGEEFDEGNDDDLQIHFDWLFSPAVIFQGSTVTVPFYFGVGGVVEIDDNNFDDDIDLGVRAPIGVSFLFRSVPLELFVELGLELIFIDDNNDDDDLDIDGVVGVRYYF
jgi:hypothetical protein